MRPVPLIPELSPDAAVPDMVVVIPTHGGAPLLRRTLQGLEECAKPLSYRETIVVENGQKGAAEEIVRDFAATLRARHVHVPQPSKSLALNHVIGLLNDELIVFLDDDVRLCPELLTAYGEAAKRSPHKTFFGGPFGVDYEQAPPAWMNHFLPRSARGWERKPELPAGKEPFLGFNWAAFVPDLRDAGCFDLDRGPGAASGMTVGDESLLQRRMIGRGIREVYVPGARVWHNVPKDRCTPEWLLDRTFRHGMAKGWQRGGERPAMFGRPTWIYQRRFNAIVKGVAEWLSLSPRLRFRRAHRNAFNRGLWVGAAKKHAEDQAARRAETAAFQAKRSAQANGDLGHAQAAGGHG